jgi:hypothetical protein
VRKKTEYLRYSRPIPGERVQINTCKIEANLYQYTAIGDCTRYIVLKIYKKRTAGNTLNFLEKVIEERPFPSRKGTTAPHGILTSNFVPISPAVRI